MELIKLEEPREGITVITLNRPEKRNALSCGLMTQLSDAIDLKGPKGRVIILKGEGQVFCAGLDLAEAQDPSHMESTARALARMLSTFYNSPCVTIAAVHGAALAGGAGLMAACDLAIAEEKTLFGLPETRRGLVAAQIMPLLSRQLRSRDLRELLLLGELIDAPTAQKIGLINRVVPNNRMMPEALKYADSILKGAPEATVKTKKLIEELYAGNFEEELLHALEYHHMARESQEAKEGIAAFLEKRDPLWAKKTQGR